MLFAATILVHRPVPAASQEAWRGAGLFHQCASCHREKGTGKGPVALYLTVQPADLTWIGNVRTAPFRATRSPAQGLLRLLEP